MASDCSGSLISCLPSLWYVSVVWNVLSITGLLLEFWIDRVTLQ